MANSCAICGENHPKVLKEYHHVFGKSNSSETVLLCHNCHDKITSEQNKFPVSARKKEAPKVLKIAFGIRTVGSLMEVSGKQLIRFSDEILEMYKNGESSIKGLH